MDMDISEICLVADTHFNHENIIKYCNRPFKDIEEMNESIIENWNSVIKKDDIVYHLGDFGFGSLEDLKQIFDRLNGKKYLIMGNHDLRYGKNFFIKLGFIQVYKKGSCQIDNLLLTHYPKKVEIGIFNYYGHIHNDPEEEQYKDGKHKCISLERTGYKPIRVSK